ncbi:BgtA-20661 [Blumeria graminis f. sp. tritici]|uniref:BgtA-20661 n=2 Tax=Blumeria graminis f. sp. tritici TaxID=62690 RepID=A0A9X9PQD6_BLUGR|nr:hypothetical protein BGT96224_A20661 [Blumeria graminis f. sp. tritici 96224]VCU38840.1 BgtA-20661 [Blumeria graminis f. sp. tritici]
MKAVTACNFPENNDMYGLGIRLAFYTLWLGTILACRMAPRQASMLRMTNSLFVTAIIISLIIKIRENNISPIEKSVILFMCFSGYLYILPLYIGRILAICFPIMNPTCFYQREKSRIQKTLNFLLMVFVSGFNLKFWVEIVYIARPEACNPIGFFFKKVPLEESDYRMGNIMFYFSWIFSCLMTLGIKFARASGRLQYIGQRRSRRQNPLLALQTHTILNLILAAISIFDIELTLRWNNMQGPKIWSASQILPLTISIGMVIRSILLFSSGTHTKKKSASSKRITSESRSFSSPSINETQIGNLQGPDLVLLRTTERLSSGAVQPQFPRNSDADTQAQRVQVLPLQTDRAHPQQPPSYHESLPPYHPE